MKNLQDISSNQDVKEFIIKEAAAFVDNPEVIAQIPLTNDFPELHNVWSNTLIGSFQKYCLETQLFDGEIKLQKKNFFYGFLSRIMITLAVFLFLFEREESFDAFSFLFLFYITSYFVFSFIKFTLMDLRTIDFYSVAMKELSLVTTMSFDHFFTNEKTKDHYSKLLEKGLEESRENVRDYLQFTLMEIGNSFITETSYNFKIKSRCLENLAGFQRDLLLQFDSRVYINENYQKLFKHREHTFSSKGVSK